MPSMAHFANLLIIFQENQKRSYTKNPCLIETIREGGRWREGVEICAVSARRRGLTTTIHRVIYINYEYIVAFDLKHPVGLPKLSSPPAELSVIDILRVIRKILTVYWQRPGLEWDGTGHGQTWPGMACQQFQSNVRIVDSLGDSIEF